MSNAASSQQNPNQSADDWDHLLRQLEEHWAVRDMISRILNKANAAFAAQYSQPDAHKFAEACDHFASFLNLKVHLEHSEQELVIQILQVACAMQENAVNNPTLSASEVAAHHLASASLVALCKSAVESGGITHTELWCEVFNLSHRAEQALSNAMDVLDISKHLDFENVTNDDFGVPGNDAEEESLVPPPAPTVPNFPTLKAPLRDITDVRQPAALKERALVAMKSQPPKGAPLGRAHTMPAMSRTASKSHDSPVRQAPVRSSSRGNALHALPETEE